MGGGPQVGQEAGGIRSTVGCEEGLHLRVFWRKGVVEVGGRRSGRSGGRRGRVAPSWIG